MTASIGAFERGDVSIHQILATFPGAGHELPLARRSYVREELGTPSEAAESLRE